MTGATLVPAGGSGLDGCGVRGFERVDGGDAVGRDFGPAVTGGGDREEGREGDSVGTRHS